MTRQSTISMFGRLAIATDAAGRLICVAVFAAGDGVPTKVRDIAASVPISWAGAR